MMPRMPDPGKRTRVVDATIGTIDPAALTEANEPVILRGAANQWPLVRAGADTPAAAARYLSEYDIGQPMVRYVGSSQIGGRFFYDDTLTGFNFTAERVTLTAHLTDLLAVADMATPPALYVGSTKIDACAPGLRIANSLSADFGTITPTASVWIGNRTIAATHYDTSHNLACCAVGHRRFTLFPPDQIANLYPGPLEPTPGGQVVSMVDMAAPDLLRYPGFERAWAKAEIADLQPGDVLFYPALWWHQVDALDDFNVLVNYWWNDCPDWQDPPMGALLHAILSLRDRSAFEKQAWRALFDHYVFGDPTAAAAHIPAQARGALAPLDDAAARRLRATLIGRLNR